VCSFEASPKRVKGLTQYLAGVSLKFLSQAT
jgi:hypothetical protein